MRISIEESRVLEDYKGDHRLDAGLCDFCTPINCYKLMTHLQWEERIGEETMEAALISFSLAAWKTGTSDSRPLSFWSQLTCECGFGCSLLALWNINLSMVTSRDRCILNSVTVNVSFDIPPFQGDAVICLGDTAKIPGRIQACLERQRKLGIMPGTRRVGDLMFLSEIQGAPANGWKCQHFLTVTVLVADIQI